ncbi:MAG: 1-deoxy-D-xylulose-5-phosphate synthase [Ruminococcaceae bacterium]|nr:1-deoxy-D-xylulose-5-phosphate synthase [Oscillospiraceae bacterium]
MYEILDKINSPQDLKGLDEKQIKKLNEEIRSFLVESVTKTGGHLASNLGVVELSVALHRVFDTPNDRIIFDVGHQSYVHKILTGRKNRFSTLRCENGLSGFTKMSESEYDCFGAGHSSTAISAALGFAQADRIAGRDNYTVAVVGDGAFTGGMVYEALNNCEKNLKLIIILNENEMSISKNVGNLSHHISKMRATKGYFRFKRGVSRFFGAIPLVGKPITRAFSWVKFKAKSAVYNMNFFENMGVKYLGPINGNDYYTVETMLSEAKKRGGCVLVHLKTVKGCGYDDAVANPEKYHGISPFDSKRPQNGSFSSHMGQYLCDFAETDGRVCAITAAMSCGTGLESFEKRFPQRYFDVGIAESHAVTFFAGLSAAGMKPVFAVYSTFLQRSYDNLLHDVALQKLGGLLLIDRAGFAPEDGATHHGIYDAAFLSQLGGITVYEPISFSAFEAMIKKSLSSDGLFAIRYPKGGEDEEVVDLFKRDDENFDILTLGEQNGTLPENVIITYGRIVTEAYTAQKELAKKGIDVGIVLLQTLKPLEKQARLIAEKLGSSKGKIAFLEEGIFEGGVSMLLCEKLSEMQAISCKETAIFAIRGDIPEQAPIESLYKKCGISCDDVVRFMSGEKQ